MRKSVGLVVVMGLLAGCTAERKAAQVTPAPTVRATGGAGSAGTMAAARRYIDPELGFEISRPDEHWQLDADDHGTADGLVIPVVMRHAASGTQVVLQVAPAVATPTQFAERLTSGLRGQEGFTASEPEPLPLSENSVGFKFAVGDKVAGRVAVLNGNEGQVFLMMATWPQGAGPEVQANVDQIFSSLKAVPRLSSLMEPTKHAL